MKFQILTEVLRKIHVFWSVVLCSLLHRSFSRRALLKTVNIIREHCNVHPKIFIETLVILTTSSANLSLSSSSAGIGCVGVRA